MASTLAAMMDCKVLYEDTRTEGNCFVVVDFLAAIGAVVYSWTTEARVGRQSIGQPSFLIN